MFVFIHGTLASQSLWLPQIRAILSLGREYSDQEIINTFTLQLPGHPHKDSSFAYKEFKVLLDEFQKTNHPLQVKMSQKMVLKGDPRVIQGLQNKKLTLISHSIGGALTLEYAIKNTTNINKMVLASTPAKFNRQYITFMRFFINTVRAINPKLFTLITTIIPIKRWRVASHTLTVNPKQLAFRSCLDYLSQYDFKHLYQISSLNQQLSLSNIPILLIGGSSDFISPVRSIENLQKILTPKNAILKAKKTVIQGKILNHDSVQVKIYHTGHNPMDTKLAQFSEDAKVFLFDQ